MTDVTQEMLKNELGDPRVQVACIGPAGENLVRLASVVVGAHGCCGKSLEDRIFHRSQSPVSGILLD